ncbi:MAG: quinone-dependent dihydroorotate dehydrogenase [Porticoccaceae bacterium]|nr:quinone-dependent dihydroorotate dehydrogenase [Porticoccaceae bacterium]
MYSSLRNLLFCFPAETAHELSLDMLGASERLGLMKLFAAQVPDKPVEVMGLSFANPVGLAAGLDKNGDCFNALGALGFGFVEVGTVTPRPQPGNAKPRMFRLPEAEAIINRMGFNNLGIDHLVANVARRRYQGVLGINIGKNVDTPVEQALDDYLLGLEKAYDHADYITINISSPNTPGLRTLQFGDSLKSLLNPVKTRQQQLADATGRYVPLAVKIAPDMSDDEIRETAKTLVSAGIDGVIATNTTLGRQGVEGLRYGDEAGGLSGAPVREKSTQVIGALADALENRLPIIGVGGIDSASTAREKIEAGATLLQIYTGFIYKGPQLIRDIVDGL